jgi:PTS system galactitol-specific IIA component
MVTQNIDAALCEAGGKLFVALEGSASTSDEAIRICANALQANGCVTEKFADDCLDREKEYPTGICCETPVALPHCQSDAIRCDALCYLRLDEPVSFYRMDDAEDTVMTRHVFNLAIAPGEHLEFLSKTIQMLQDNTVLESFTTMTSTQIASYLARNLS